MTTDLEDNGEPKPVLNGWRGFAKSRDGATAIEFALLAIPYFVIIFAILETFIAFTAEQLVSNAVDTLGRQLRTGQITYNHNAATDQTAQQFRQLFCNQISILIQCSATEVATPDKLWLDVETYTSFASMPTTVPMKNGDLDTSGFSYGPGGPSTINMLRAYYRWQIITDLVRPYVSTVHPTNGATSVFLIVATAAFQNEKYPEMAPEHRFRRHFPKAFQGIAFQAQALLGLCRRFRQDTKGIGAIEFAILAPVLLLLYLGALETTIGLSFAKRASRASGTVADIVTQQSSVNKAFLATMPSAAGAIFAPYATTGLTLKITGIAIDTNANATVAWSWAQDGSTPYAAGSVPSDVPTDMDKASSFLVRTELAIPYTMLSFGPNFLPAGTNTITIAKKYFYRQRTGTSITCSDC